MTLKPTVSVLTTCYNRETYLADAIESVLVSSFEDFEYIIVDDGSQDRSVEIARDYAARDRRIQVHVNDANLGDYPNRNRAASFAQGALLKYVDSDDLLYPHGLEVMVACMRHFPDAGIGFSRPHDPTEPFPARLRPHEAYERHYFGVGLLGYSPLSAIIRRTCFEAVGGFSGARYIGDTELWHALARRYDVILMPMGLTWWRIHGAQESSNERHTLDAVSARHALTHATLTHEACPLSPTQVGMALDAARVEHAQEVLWIARRVSVRKAATIAKASDLRLSDIGRALVARVARWVD